MDDGKLRTEQSIAARSATSSAPVDNRGPVWDRLGVRFPWGDDNGKVAKPPVAAISVLRVTVGVLLAALCLLSVGGAVLLLLLWQQSRASGVLTTQLERTWDLIDTLQVIERWVAFGVVPVAMGWIALAAWNAGRATGVHRNPVFAGLSLPVCLAAVWYFGDEFVDGRDELYYRVGGYALQVFALWLAMMAVRRIAIAADSRHGPLRAAFVTASLYLAHLQFLGGLSTIDRGEASEHWGQWGAYLLIAGLLQVVGAMAVNETMRAIEDSTQHRYELRSRFSESLLAQAELQASGGRS